MFEEKKKFTREKFKIKSFIKSTKRYMSSKTAFGLIWKLIRGDAVLLFLLIVRFIFIFIVAFLHFAVYYSANNRWEKNLIKHDASINFLEFLVPFLFFATNFILLCVRDCLLILFSHRFERRIEQILIARVIYREISFYDKYTTAFISEAFTDTVENAISLIENFANLIQNIIFIVLDFIILFLFYNESKINGYINDVKDKFIKENFDINSDDLKITISKYYEKLLIMKRVISFGTISITLLTAIFVVFQILLRYRLNLLFSQQRKKYFEVLDLINETMREYIFIQNNSLYNKFVILNQNSQNKLNPYRVNTRKLETILTIISYVYGIGLILILIFTSYTINQIFFNGKKGLINIVDTKHKIILTAEINAIVISFYHAYVATIRTIAGDIFELSYPLSSISYIRNKLIKAGKTLLIIDSPEQEEFKVKQPIEDPIYSNSKIYLKYFSKENNLCYPNCKRKIYYEQQYILHGENIYFKHGNRVIFDNLNFKFFSDENIYVIGPSGAGKSALFNIITGRNIINSGNIYIQRLNDKNEIVETIYKDKVNLCCWLSHFNYMAQKNNLLSMSVKDNIELVINNKECVWFNYKEAAKLSACYDFVNRLENKFDSIVSATNNFSGGQQQRICISRLFVKKAKFYILDEITSALDKISANFVIRNIRKNIIGGKMNTTHNLNELLDEDMIFLMENGKVIDNNTHEYLKKNNNLYQKLIFASSEND